MSSSLSTAAAKSSLLAVAGHAGSTCTSECSLVLLRPMLSQQHSSLLSSLGSPLSEWPASTMLSAGLSASYCARARLQMLLSWVTLAGDLGLHWLSSAAFGLFSWILCARPGRLVNCVATFALDSPRSWMGRVAASLSALGVDWFRHIGRGCPSSARSRFLRCVVRPLLAAKDLAAWHSLITNTSDPDLYTYGSLAIRPAVASVHGPRCSPAPAAAWGRLRSGSSCSAAHRVPWHVNGSGVCTLCGHATCDTFHLVAVCPHLSMQRASWWASVDTGFHGQSPSDLSPPVLLAFMFNSQAPPGLAALHAGFAALCENRLSSGS